jgi:hypothetical protein
MEYGSEAVYRTNAYMGTYLPTYLSYYNKTHKDTKTNKNSQLLSTDGPARQVASWMILLHGDFTNNV